MVLFNQAENKEQPHEMQQNCMLEVKMLKRISSPSPFKKTHENNKNTINFLMPKKWPRNKNLEQPDTSTMKYSPRDCAGTINYYGPNTIPKAVCNI